MDTSSTETVADKIREELEAGGICSGERLALATKAEISPSYLSDWLWRRCALGGQAALRLSRALEGRFSVEELVAVKPLPAWKRRRLAREVKARRKAKAS